MLKWLERLKEYYGKFNNKKQAMEELHKIDMEFWIKSLKLVQVDRINECDELISQQIMKMDKI